MYTLSFYHSIGSFAYEVFMVEVFVDPKLNRITTAYVVPGEYGVGNTDCMIYTREMLSPWDDNSAIVK